MQKDSDGRFAALSFLFLFYIPSWFFLYQPLIWAAPGGRRPFVLVS